MLTPPLSILLLFVCKLGFKWHDCLCKKKSIPTECVKPWFVCISICPHANKGKWGGPTTDMLENIKTLTLDEVKEYSSDILKFNKTNGTGRQDQHWLLKLICNSCLSDLRDIIDETFNELPVHQQGGSVYLKFIYDVVFNMTEPVICVLQNWIRGFANNGLHKVPGKNICTLYNAAWNISECLHEVDALPSDAAMDILTGLTKATNDDFTCPFKLLKS
jgi:hypothetical protein